ncbi:hypothetical protein QFZ77_004469 [Paenibacillus sp. V4I3]|nr:hypothetical protein [Paenibacillus sp. V4I3]MDQ0888120.1 hypothetical protein [Paenibacillus sp. V4I9]
MRILSVLLLLCGDIMASGCQQDRTPSMAVSTFEAIPEKIQKEQNASTYEVTDATTSSTQVSKKAPEVSVPAYGLWG